MSSHPLTPTSHPDQQQASHFARFALLELPFIYSSLTPHLQSQLHQSLLIAQMGNNHYIQQIHPEEFKQTHPFFPKAIVEIEEGKKWIKSKLHCQEKQYKQWKDKVFPSTNNEQKLSHEFLYLPIKTDFEHDKEFCSNTGFAVNVYPYFETLLSSQIMRRQPSNDFFKESQLWYLLYVLAAAKADISKLNQRMGDIKPSNIFIDEQKNIKVGNLLSSPLEETNYAKLKNNQTVHFDFLLAPEDIAAAQQGLIDNKTNPQSEIFSIGATILSAGLLQTFQNAYNFKELAFLEDAFKEKVAKWISHSKYSLIFKSIIINLTDLDASKRIQFDQFWKFISRHGLNIKSKDPFIINHPPECLQSAIPMIQQKQKAK